MHVVVVHVVQNNFELSDRRLHKFDICQQLMTVANLKLLILELELKRGISKWPSLVMAGWPLRMWLQVKANWRFTQTSRIAPSNCRRLRETLVGLWRVDDF